MKIIKTAIYVRVSTEEQAKEGFSIRAQQSKLKDYIRIKGWELYDIYIDEGISGKNIEARPAINQLIADVMQKRIENVLVFKIDRLTRSTKDLITLMEIFNDNDCAFNSLMESIDTRTPSGRMFIKIIGIFAEFERENLIERVSIALEKKVREGYTIANFNTPYGYTRDKGSREIKINEEESKIVREIFYLYLNKHKTFNAIAETFNMRNIKKSNNALWTAASVKYILTNPLYMGKVRYAINDENRYFETDGRHESIISEDIFINVQNKLSKMKKRVIKKRPKEDNYYCGTLMCGECGSKMTTHGIYSKNKDGNPIYYCGYKCTAKAHGNCNSGTISHNKVDVVFREYMEQIKDFEVESEIDLNINDNNVQEDIDLLKTEYTAMIEKLSKKEKDIMTLYINDKVNFDEYEQMIKIIKTEKTAYTAKLDELQDTEIIDIQIKREDIINNFKENWDLLTKLERMQFLQTYIKAIYVAREPDIENTNKKLIKIKKVEFYQN